MLKFLRVFLILSFLGGLGTTFASLYNNPLLLVISLLFNTLIFIGFWKGTTLVTNSPEDQTTNKWIHLLRWVLLFIFSIVAVQLGVLIIFIFRFVIDRAYVDGNQIVVDIVKGLGPLYSKILILLGLLLSFLPMNLVSRALKFSKPLFTAIIMIVIWAILMLVIGPFLSSVK